MQGPGGGALASAKLLPVGQSAPHTISAKPHSSPRRERLFFSRQEAWGPQLVRGTAGMQTHQTQAFFNLNPAASACVSREPAPQG